MKFLNLQAPFLVVRSWVMGRSIGSVVRGTVGVRGPVGVGVMRGRRVVRRRRGVGCGLVVAVGRRSGSGVGGGVGFRVRVMRIRVMGSGDHVVRVDGMVRDDVSAVAVGSEVGGRYALT